MFCLETVEQEQRYNIVQKLRDYFYTLNVFPSIPPSIEEYQLQNERISTRLFILLLISSLGILLLYSSLINVTQTVNIKAPTIAQYSQLYLTYPQTLTCPCTKISINYETFLNVQYTFHQVCNSSFVTQDWIDYLYAYSGNRAVYVIDFPYIATNTFQGLSTLCALVNQTISNDLSQFYSSQYVSASVTTLNTFQSEISALVNQFILSTTNDFLLSLSTIRSTTQSNSIYSALQTNCKFDAYPDFNVLAAYPDILSYGSCSCATLATCASQSKIHGSSNLDVLFYVPGIYIGCYIIESLLQSDLRCFYNQTCINQLQSYSLANTTVNVTALNNSLSSRFFENSTIEELVNQLMVEEWNSSRMYDNYYNECQPSQCTYTHQTKNSIIYIVTTLVGLIGGLITVLKLIVPRLVMFVRNKRELPRIQNGKITSKTSLYLSYKLTVSIRYHHVSRRQRIAELRGSGICCFPFDPIML